MRNVHVKMRYFIQPVKMMRYRGSDDDVVGFGHFCEVRKVMTGPSDSVAAVNGEWAMLAFIRTVCGKLETFYL